MRKLAIENEDGTYRWLLSSGFMIAEARIGIPEDGLGFRLDRIKEWLDGNCRANGWAMTPSGTRGVLNDALCCGGAVTSFTTIKVPNIDHHSVASSGIFAFETCVVQKTQYGFSVLQCSDSGHSPMSPTVRNTADMSNVSSESPNHQFVEACERDVRDSFNLG